MIQPIDEPKHMRHCEKHGEELQAAPCRHIADLSVAGGKCCFLCFCRGYRLRNLGGNVRDGFILVRHAWLCPGLIR